MTALIGISYFATRSRLRGTSAPRVARVFTMSRNQTPPPHRSSFCPFWSLFGSVSVVSSLRNPLGPSAVVERVLACSVPQAMECAIAMQCPLGFSSAGNGDRENDAHDRACGTEHQSEAESAGGRIAGARCGGRVGEHGGNDR